MRLATLIATVLFAAVPAVGQQIHSTTSSVACPDRAASMTPCPADLHGARGPAAAPSLRAADAATAAPGLGGMAGANPDGAPPAPEPSTLLLVGSGLVGVALFARGRRRRESA